MKNVALAPLNTLLDFKNSMLGEIRSKHNVTHILLFVLISLVTVAIVAVVAVKLIQKLNGDDYDIYDDFDDLEDLDFDEDDVLADEADFIK